MWEINGVRGWSDPPPLAGQFSGPLLVCGSGRSLHEDVARAPVMDALAVNHAILHARCKIRHIASLHEDALPHWAWFRKTWGEGHLHSHSHKEGPGVENVWRGLEGAPPCSGLFGAVVGLAMGYAPITLAGVPEDNEGHFYDPPGSPGDYLTSDNRQAWFWFRDNVFRGRVRSLSGRTREWLGAPDGI